jgi:hypothetical protein
MSYSQFMHGLRVAEIELDRKVLADIAVRDPRPSADLPSKPGRLPPSRSHTSFPGASQEAPFLCHRCR